MEERSVDVLEEIEAFCGSLKLPKGFILGLMSSSEDDWTRIVKSAFLLEGISKKLLVDALNAKRVQEDIYKLDFAMCLKMAKRLEVYNDDQCRFINKIGELRNLLLHDISHHNFSLEEYFKDKNRKSAYLDCVEPFVAEQMTFTDPPIPRRKFLEENPRWGIFYGLVDVISTAVWIQAVRDFEQKRTVAMEDQMALYKRIAIPVLEALEKSIATSTSASSGK